MKRGLQIAMAILLAGWMPVSWGLVFSDVTYQHGYPGFPESSVRGTLSTEAEGIHFNTPSGQTWVIPYPALEEHRWQEKTESSGGGPGLGFLAGPNPILMAASLGFTALSYGLRKATSDRHTYLYTLRFKDQGGVSQEVALTLPNESTQKQLIDDLNHQLTAYQQRMRDDYMRVMSQQQQYASMPYPPLAAPVTSPWAPQSVMTPDTNAYSPMMPPFAPYNPPVQTTMMPPAMPAPMQNAMSAPWAPSSSLQETMTPAPPPVAPSMQSAMIPLPEPLPPAMPIELAPPRKTPNLPAPVESAWMPPSLAPQEAVMTSPENPAEEEEIMDVDAFASMNKAAEETNATYTP